jgi:hypothetical protein
MRSTIKKTAVEKELNQYVHFSNLKTDIITDLGRKLEQAEIQIEQLKAANDALLTDYLKIFEENLRFKVPCPVYGDPIGNCGGFDCSRCEILREKEENLLNSAV